MANLDSRVKTQQIRLLDVFLIGPTLLYAAAVTPKQHSILRVFLATTAVTTMAYNWRNYEIIEASNTCP